jgi:hypothetical protein
MLFSGGKITCKNCGHLVTQVKAPRSNKYGAKRTEFNGKIYDSKYEASVSMELYARKQAQEIKDYDTQFKVEIWCYRSNGQKAFKVSHKVDFRVHHWDGSYELIEAKGVETADYKMRRKFLEEIWLPDNPDHTYTVYKQGRR